ncbi:MAG: chromate resistance protein, partial [Thermoplasmata archaeon]
NIKDPAINELAKIVRSADAKVENPSPEGEGLKAAAEGFRIISKDDYENMRLQFPLYDALYAYCKKKLS